MERLTTIVCRARRGDQQAFEELARRFQDMAVGYAYALLGDWQEAEDAAQDAFLRAYVDLVKLREAAAFPGWFRRIVYTQAQRRLRAKERAWISLEKLPASAMAAPAPAADGEQAALWASINSLPAAQRSVLLLYYMDAYSQKEIASFLEIPLGTVKTRLHHARKTIRTRMTLMDEFSTRRPSKDSQFMGKLMALFEAAKHGDIERARRVLAADRGLANASGQIRTALWAADASALHVAVMHGRKDIIDLLLAHGADINARDEKYRFKALMHAIDLADFMPEYAALGMVDFLLERGAEKDVWACAWLGDHAGVIAHLDENPALVNAIGPGPSTLLSFCNDVKGVQFYLDYGADPLVAYQRGGRCAWSSPLRDITFRRNYACTRLLLAHLGWKLDIFWASVMGDEAAVAALLQADGRRATAATAAEHILGAGLSPLHLAAQGGHSAVMAVLLAAGADINAGDAQGDSPLHFAICFGPKALRDPLPKLEEAAADSGVYRLLTATPLYLLAHGADIKSRAADGLSPLELARSPFEDETDRSEVIALLEAAEAG